MCGIAGILTTRVELDLEDVLQRMQGCLHHRGPDDRGHTTLRLPSGHRLGLTQTRLSILDLSAAGHQPMHDPESGSWITFNGEVYNHAGLRKAMPEIAFRSGSDTETILKSWVRSGESALGGFRGMFAFGLLDAPRQRFWLVRDRLGVKPLYVAAIGSDTWIFASELRALLASGLCSRRLSAEAVDSYLAFGAATTPLTLLEGVQSLLPGEAWCFRLESSEDKLLPTRTRYWRPGFIPAAAPAISRQEAIERVRSVLVEAVSLRMVSDVPVGVFLSGGIDSSAIVATLASQGHKLRTFSVVFGERQFDESEHSREVARHFETAHTELLIRPEDVLRQFGQVLRAYDQPSIDGVNTYFISQATRQAGVKVALSGLGGDELFAGYSYFKVLARLDRILPRQVAQVAHRLLSWFQPRSIRTTKLGELLARQKSHLGRYAICRRVMDLERRGQLFQPAVRSREIPLPDSLIAQLEADTAELETVNAYSLLELSLYMGNMLLRDMDQMSMAHALEVREPLLDHVLVETVASIPGLMKLRPGRKTRTKGLLVDALPVELPASVLQRPKMGFVFPWERWLRHDLREYVAEILLDRASLGAAGLSYQGVQTLWSQFLAGQPGIRYTDILSLVHLLCWISQHGLALDRDADPLALPLRQRARPEGSSAR